MALTDAPRYLSAGVQCLVVEWPAVIDPEVNEQVVSLYRRLQKCAPPGWIEAIPSYRSLLVIFDPCRIQRDELLTQIQTELAQHDDEVTDAGAEVLLPTVYGGEYGPDLVTVATHAGLDAGEVIRIHSSGDYRVYMLGFTPGFPYLGGLDPRLTTPRLNTPRTRIPAGSVGIAGGQTGVYPIASPGGWQLIGRTPQVLFDPDRNPPALVQPGDRILFQAIDSQRYLQLAEELAVPVEHTTDNLGESLCTVERAGLLTTIQDLGRWGYQHLGVPTAGAMDRHALRLGNLLVGNEESGAALEITLDGPHLVFQRDTCLAVTGGDLGPMLNGQAMPMWTTVPVQAGSELKFSGRRSGCRSYLAVSGGFAVPLVMGSASTYLPGRMGGYGGRALKAGDRLSAYPAVPAVPGYSVPAALCAYVTDGKPLSLVIGPQEDRFTSDALEMLVSAEYNLTSETDRMGSRLSGPVLAHGNGADIISDGIPPGAVQVPGHGMPIIMTADRQTTGGYPKIGVVAQSGLERLAQKLPGESVRFAVCSLQEAEQAYRAAEETLAKWAASMRDKTNSRFWRMSVNGRNYQVIVTTKE
jgi:KipI family sensor histidine kinase inhibitor